MHLALHPVPASSDGPAHQAPAPDPFDPIAAAHDLAARLATTAVERDRLGGHAARERQWIRASGLLALSVPREYGGLGASWKTIADVVRIVARADSALAHLLGFHHLQIAGIRLAGNARQQRRLLFETIEHDVFWGDALNPLDKRLVARPTAGGYVLDGAKGFASGSVGSDWLTVCAWDPLAHGSLVAVLPTQRDGVAVHADWNAFGLRQADSGTVTFTNVLLTEDDVLQPAARAATPQATLRAQVAQLILTNVYVGLAEGALGAARGYLRREAQPWFASSLDVAAATDDPYVQHRFGQFQVLVRPAQVLADGAAAELDDAFARGAHLTGRERGEVALAVAEAKVVAHKAAIEIGSQLFELTGAPSTSVHHGFDRYWRDARVHTLHDPVDYKLRDIGRHALDGTLPEPTAYA
ncbi:acyl-CoA dehydrogenase family protein [Telluria mixta]|uniref:Acyl-CoA dehydrogenase family protein n=1 Tax=Telluria mixta TaxID=34071 RepID=A0ABT2C4C5_9BURK|nr:acyl-CoA dehydrogenase family protein [Telluria mixta]MCS0632181.1 acyl-CoA dehydrogenase family protein [Telluria mixta]WEM95148.1 acyl-CoA dehydrogenase family protein [Telluria mixta]